MDEQTALRGKDWMAGLAIGAMDEYLHLARYFHLPADVFIDASGGVGH